MSNHTYTKYISRVLGSGSASLIDWNTDTIKAVLVRSSGYTPNLTSDEFLSDIPSGARVATQTLASVTITGKVIDCDDPTFASVAAGAAIDLFAVYKDTGSAATSPLALLLDTFTTNWPVTPDGGDIIIAIDAAGLWKMG